MSVLIAIENQCLLCCNNIASDELSTKSEEICSRYFNLVSQFLEVDVADLTAEATFYCGQNESPDNTTGHSVCCSCLPMMVSYCDMYDRLQQLQLELLQSLENIARKESELSSNEIKPKRGQVLQKKASFLKQLMTRVKMKRMKLFPQCPQQVTRIGTAFEDGMDQTHPVSSDVKGEVESVDDHCVINAGGYNYDTRTKEEDIMKEPDTHFSLPSSTHDLNFGNVFNSSLPERPTSSVDTVCKIVGGAFKGAEPELTQPWAEPDWPGTGRTDEKSTSRQFPHPKEEAPEKNQCKICGKCFSLKGNLVKHVNLHSGNKPFRCKTCDKCFALRGNLVKHEKLHIGHKLFRCDLCGKCFATRGNLVKHNERIHFPEDQPFFKCNLCESWFSSRTSLLKHEEKHLKCTICGKYFTGQKKLNVHIQQQHTAGNGS